MKTPWHLWLIGIVSLLWNAAGAFDYYMTQSQNAEYLGAFTTEQLAYFEGLPVWVVIAWAFGVWGALLGSLLLLIRSRHAVTMFGLSLAGMVVNIIYGFALSGQSMTKLMGTGALIFSLVIVVVGLFLYVYAGAMRRKGVLS